MNTISFNDILKNKLDDFETTYIINDYFLLNDLSQQFQYFNYIKIAIYNDELIKNLNEDTIITLSVGGQLLLHDKINTKLNNEYYTFNVHFPNSCFYVYHSLQLKIQEKIITNKYKIIVNGCKFSNEIYKYHTIILNHDSKYYTKDKYEWFISNGIVTNKIQKVKETYEIIENTLSKDILSKDTLSKDTLSKNTLSKDILLKDTLSKDTLSKDTLLKDTSKNSFQDSFQNKLNEYELQGKIYCEKYTLDNQEYNLTIIDGSMNHSETIMCLLIYKNVVCTNYEAEIQYNYVKECPDKFIIYYELPRGFDMLRHLKILNVFEHSYDYELLLNYDVNDIYLNKYNSSEKQLIKTNNFLFVNKQYHKIFLKVIIYDSKQLFEWNTLKISLGLCFMDSHIRKIAMNSI